MTKIRGIQITLISKKPVGKNPFGEVIHEDVEIPVENVLVVPAENEDVRSAMDLYGKRAAYTLGIPKGDTHDWEDVEVRFFGASWRTFGISTMGIDHLIPLDWNRKVLVERYD